MFLLQLIGWGIVLFLVLATVGTVRQLHITEDTYPSRGLLSPFLRMLDGITPNNKGMIAEIIIFFVISALLSFCLLSEQAEREFYYHSLALLMGGTVIGAACWMIGRCQKKGPSKNVCYSFTTICFLVVIWTMMLDIKIWFF